MLSFVFPGSRLLSVEAAHELSLYLQLQEHRGSRGHTAQGHTHYRSHQNLLHSACVPVRDIGLGALLSTAPLRARVPSLGQHSCLLPCTEHSTDLFQCMHGRRGIYLVYLEESQTFPRNYNAWKYCWLRHREEYVQTWPMVP